MCTVGERARGICLCVKVRINVRVVECRGWRSRWRSGSVWRDVALPSRGRRRARLLLERPVRRVRTWRHSGCDTQPWRPGHLQCPPAAGQRLLGHASQRPPQPQVIPTTHHSLIQVPLLQLYLHVLRVLLYHNTEWQNKLFSLSKHLKVNLVKIFNLKILWPKLTRENICFPIFCS